MSEKLGAHAMGWLRSMHAQHGEKDTRGLEGIEAEHGVLHHADAQRFVLLAQALQIARCALAEGTVEIGKLGEDHVGRFRADPEDARQAIDGEFRGQLVIDHGFAAVVGQFMQAVLRGNACGSEGEAAGGDHKIASCIEHSMARLIRVVAENPNQPAS